MDPLSRLTMKEKAWNGMGENGMGEVGIGLGKWGWMG